ncbi:transcriptional regulator SplA domain-containing protein [Bacillus velezensis]|uniref:transcriptional regulator SplA domain-containing protein n=1 Tax=Bacillus velezensis TaxID=492670 RepID=UPI00155AADE2|nr:transcriptional regulator SplA domain-containing protein [Bacillus velezensis]MCC9262920.1 transcriptional regulator [Bacillus velezensis]NRR25408.1 transcriptional regulator [Bacillus velezensis]QKF33225.1 transcriptional regulator [Bacillus velezensis]
MTKSFAAGDTVYVIYRNPHAANVAHIKEAEIVHHPYHEGELSLFLYETYHPLAEDDAVFTTYEEAEALYSELFEEDRYH